LTCLKDTNKNYVQENGKKDRRHIIRRPIWIQEKSREAILALRIIIKKRIKKNKPTFIDFVDIARPFDKVNSRIMFEILKSTGVAITERKLLYQLYKNEIAITKIGDI